MPTPTDPKLWAKARARVKARVAVWPSAYASGQLVQEYKRMGGGFTGAKAGSDLARWYKERWVDVCEWPKPVACGEPGGAYPYCRPSVKASAKTPVTVQALTPAQRRELCAKKRRSPSKRMKPAKAKQ